jgi:hypothetical protein
MPFPEGVEEDKPQTPKDDDDDDDGEIGDDNNEGLVIFYSLVYKKMY